MLTKKEIQAKADKIYPIVPLNTREDVESGKILNDDELLESFRLTIQSVSSNIGYVRGYEDAQNTIFNSIIAVGVGFIIGLLICMFKFL